MISLETSIAALVTFFLGLAAGLWVLKLGFKWWVHHAMHCRHCREFYTKKLGEHESLDIACPFQSFREKESH
jgi:hypothetical protein